jgi:murein DD-endopeptidase MepM/ murein hydrolase activator NlpD
MDSPLTKKAPAVRGKKRAKTPRKNETATRPEAPAHHSKAQVPKRHTQSIGTALTITRSNPPTTCRKLELRAKTHRKAAVKAATRRAWHKGARACAPDPKPVTKHKKKKQNKKPIHVHRISSVRHHLAPHHASGGGAVPNARKMKPRVMATTKLHVAPTVSAPAPAAPTVWNDGFNLNPFDAQQLERFSTVSANLDQPPGFLIPIYKAAGRRFHLPWQVLAAINAIETDYGRNLSVSPAGAIGWMQFMPETWARYGLAANGTARANPYDPRDAIFSAARYLDESWGAKHIRRALYAYNHAWWYVDEVLWRAQLISDHALGKHARQNGYALPLDLRYMMQLGRTDDGVDIEDAPDGVAVYSMTPGIVTDVASDPAGFGPDYPVILATRGPLAGQYVYYGHVAASLVRVGQRVLAGQPIAVMGHTGDAASLAHGHVEIGFSDASGDPLNHHGAGAWTPSGDAMRRVMTALTKAFVVAREHAASQHPTEHKTEPARAPRQPDAYASWSVLRARRMRPS